MNTLASISPNHVVADNKVSKTHQMKEQASRLTDSFQAKEALQQFQGLMVHMMMKSMRETIDKNELFNGGQGEEIFQTMLDEKQSYHVASTDVFGLEKTLRQSMRLPLNENYRWEDIEKLDETKQKELYQQLQVMAPQLGQKDENSQMPLSAKVARLLDGVVKTRQIEKHMDEKALEESSFYHDWKTERDSVLEKMGVYSDAGPELVNKNKEFLKNFFPQIEMGMNQQKAALRALKEYRQVEEATRR